VCGRASESTIIGLIIPESATGIVTTFDICRFQGVTALALTTLWKPWVFAINYRTYINIARKPLIRKLLASTGKNMAWALGK
jgi:hypothetical protein